MNAVERMARAMKECWHRWVLDSATHTTVDKHCKYCGRKFKIKYPHGLPQFILRWVQDER